MMKSYLNMKNKHIAHAGNHNKIKIINVINCQYTHKMSQILRVSSKTFMLCDNNFIYLIQQYYK